MLSQCSLPPAACLLACLLACAGYRGFPSHCTDTATIARLAAACLPCPSCFPAAVIPGSCLLLPAASPPLLRTLDWTLLRLLQESPYYDYLPLRCGSAVACSLMSKDYEACKEVRVVLMIAFSGCHDALEAGCCSLMSRDYEACMEVRSESDTLAHARLVRGALSCAPGRGAASTQRRCNNRLFHIPMSRLNRSIAGL